MFDHRIGSIAKALSVLHNLSEEHIGNPTLLGLNNFVLTDVQFLKSPASAKKHHAYEGGLVIHTAQVASIALGMLQDVQDARLDLVLTAAIWHDFGKSKDYVKVDEGFDVTPHRHLVGHLPLSYSLFREYLAESETYGEGYPLTDEERMRVEHMILSHHGRLEWRSPVEPQTAEAWALHAADMMSAWYVGVSSLWETQKRS